MKGDSKTLLINQVTTLLREYAKEKGTIVRSTSDLSPLEEWLVIKIARLTIALLVEKYRIRKKGE